MIDCPHETIRVTADERRICVDCGKLLSVGHGKRREEPERVAGRAYTPRGWNEWRVGYKFKNGETIWL